MSWPKIAPKLFIMKKNVVKFKYSNWIFFYWSLIFL